jgi:16S rRNA (adenine1518-N6/adenine1519-N6)-dimethyltransferase
VDHPLTLPHINFPTLMKRHGLQPDKRLGQNFLIDDHIIQKIIRTAGITNADHVLEIGAGLGNLTRYLGYTADQVIAVEIDGRLTPVLSDIVKPYSNVQIIQSDILEIDPGDLFANASPHLGYTVIANIPYYITSAVIRHLLESKPRPDKIFLTIQREVAQRICEKPGKLSLLALSVQVYGEPKIAFNIPSGAFYPQPKVTSSFLQIATYPEPRISPSLLDLFFKLSKAGFSQKRKKLRNSLAKGMTWSVDKTEDFLMASGIDPNRRAETLSIDEWGALAARLG